MPLYASDYDGKGKNDHFREMLDKAEKRDIVLFCLAPM